MARTRAYFASKISEHLSVTPEGFLVATDCVVARDGFQRYMVSDLPPKRAEELGVDLSRGNAFVDLYRPAEEVFSPATLASFEGKVLTDNHPDGEFVDPDNVKKYSCGHIQNVRRGPAPLESGDWPMMADLIIMEAKLIDKVKNKDIRELSLGYDYTLVADGDKLLQTEIRGNHCAVVNSARAGPEARINDAAPEPKKVLVKPEIRPSIMKGVLPVNKKWKDILIGLGFKALAADAETKPEDLAAAMRAAGRDSDEDEEEKKKAKDAEEKKEKEMADKKAKDASEAEEKKKEEDKKKAKDAEEAEEKKKEEDKKKAKDAEKAEEEKKAADAEAAKGKGEHFKLCGDKACMARDCRMHGALDAVLKENPAEEGEEADLEELKEVLGEVFGGAGGADESEVIEPLSMDEEEPMLEKGIKGEAGDATADRSKEHAFLLRIKPVIAKARTADGKPDLQLRAEFNARLEQFSRSSTVSEGTYASFGRAVGKGRDRKPGGGAAGQPDYSELQKHYDALRGKIHQEVK